jgi:predicted dehydrogenase
LTRRSFLKRSAFASAAAAGFPAILASTALGAEGSVAPSNRITMGCIGVGRMGTANMLEFLGFPNVRVVAVCDVDAKRCEAAKQKVDEHYGDQGCATHHDFRELLARPDIETVLICTPDHWHALPAIAAAKAGKDIYLEKPLTYSVAEGRVLSDTVRRYVRVLQAGSQQRSEHNFRFACELARNGRLGKIHTVKVGLPTDPGCEVRPPMPVPKNLDYDFWIGPAPWASYTEDRCHPQDSYDRPGWLRMADYCAGMITGWGAHHNDIAQWGLGTEYTGPVEVEGRGMVPRDGLWDVHGDFRIEYTYANGVKLLCADENHVALGTRFEGSDGWVYVSRGVTEAEPKTLLKSVIGPQEIHLYASNNHKGNFLECVRKRKEPAAPVEVGHRSCTVCLLGSIAMQLGRKLRWNPDQERFVNDPAADRLLARPMRGPWRL